MYAREIEGRVLSFGVSGKLIRNSLVMYARETDSLWSQFVGAAVVGELTGTRLQPLASTFTDWSTWRDLHPDTLLLEQGRFRPIDPYGSDYAGPQAGVVGEENDDDRLSGKSEVLELSSESLSNPAHFRARPAPSRRLSWLSGRSERAGGKTVPPRSAAHPATLFRWPRSGVRLYRPSPPPLRSGRQGASHRPE